MNEDIIVGALEGILFMAGDAVETADIAAALEIDTDQLDGIVTRMMEKRLQERSGLQIIKVGSKLQMSTNPEYAPYIEKVLAPVKKRVCPSRCWRRSPLSLTHSPPPALR